ncbi:DUF2252 family protein [Gottfriedia sp. NPDC056225]|uniref:DUF2252 family protein n=1 Tax=Gottfriedia sp. NPDC056225 TaxID=3345751 RepID=UPI00155900F9|nr:DUF2252 family protein [Arthrobacter citreus]
MKRTILTLTACLSILPVSTSYAADQSSSRESYIQSQLTTVNSFITDSTVRQEKYISMEESPFAFYRATNPLFYADLGTGVIPIPSTWKTTANIKTWIQGDAHTQNIGYFDNSKGEVVFDLNDSDESYVAPFYWDLIRFSTSVFLMANEAPNVSLSMQDRRDLVTSFLTTYQDTLTAVNGNSGETTTQLDEGTLTGGFVQDEMRDIKSSDSVAKLLNKWTTTTSGTRLFNFSNSNLKAVTSTERSNIVNNWTNYKASISSFVSSKPSTYFTIKDIARRLHSGLGSLGVDKFYVLIEGDTTSQSDDVILEVKEQRNPSMFLEGSLSQAQYNSWFPTHANRSKTGELADGIKVDNHLGEINFNNKSYRVQRISPWDETFDAADFKSKSDVQDFLKYSAKALAYAHARADKDYNTTYVNYNFEQGVIDAINAWPQFKTTVLQLSENYYNQVLADYSLFEDLRSTGKLQ